LEPDKNIVKSVLDCLLLTPHLELYDFFHIMQGVLNYVTEVLEIPQRLGIRWLAEDL
jgi:hypothetical protein